VSSACSTPNAFFLDNKGTRRSIQENEIVDFGNTRNLVQFYGMPQTLPTSIKRKEEIEMEESAQEVLI